MASHWPLSAGLQQSLLSPPEILESRPVRHALFILLIAGRTTASALTMPKKKDEAGPGVGLRMVANAAKVRRPKAWRPFNLPGGQLPSATVQRCTATHRDTGAQPNLDSKRVTNGFQKRGSNCGFHTMDFIHLGTQPQPSTTLMPCWPPCCQQHTVLTASLPVRALLPCFVPQHNQESLSNGCLMRVTPLGVWAHKQPVDVIAQHAMADAALTHPNKTAQVGTAAE
jgi:hypothetical protein